MPQLSPLGQKFPNIFLGRKGNRKALYTKSLVPGEPVYGEELLRDGKSEYRSWDPSRSKLAAAIMKGISQIGVREGDYVLYLGAASGTTVSHVADIVGKRGLVFAVDMAYRTMRDLLFMAEKRPTVVPILCDANDTKELARRVCLADFVYMDVAQKDQVRIFLKNCDLFLKDEGFAVLCVKARSIDVTKKPKQLYRTVLKELEQRITVVDHRELDPFEKDHALFVVKRSARR
ncbi:fibrillarin-like rRNA/tRNA 2'-O-methyltransferase [Candidatus Woesearchaeota archaeon]|nr:fibrillarin-like rRNA/tRNA 2'-O-methyltransferase [Candidatus Woesearchaeota archaeon]